MNATEGRRAVGKYGGTVELYGPSGDRSANVDAPRGKVWAATGTHTIRVEEQGFQTPAKFWDAIADDVKMGLAACQQENCDVCEEERG